MPYMDRHNGVYQPLDVYARTDNFLEIDRHAFRKPIFVEPQSKDGFNSIITEYYNKIKDPQHKGAIFMAVCRGKVSEGLDFANANGRAVIITGLPFPPLKDPRVILKQRYLEENKASGKDFLTGQQWYQLEASRAVNQAIGRIIRHKNDYGAILLCDCRFDNPSFKQQLSAWIRPHIKKFPNFKTVMKDLQSFFKYAQTNLPQPVGSSGDISDVSLPAVPAQFDTSGVRVLSTNSRVNESGSLKRDENFDINSFYKNESRQRDAVKPNGQNSSFASLLDAKPKSVINFSTCKPQKLASNLFSAGTTSSANEPSAKRRKFKPVNFHLDKPAIPSTSALSKTRAFSEHSSQPIDGGALKKEQAALYVKEVKNSLPKETFKTFKTIVGEYQTSAGDVAGLLIKLEKIFIEDRKLKHLLIGFKTFLKPDHLQPFDEHVQFMQNSNIW